MTHQDKPSAHAQFSPGWSDFTDDWFTPRIQQWKEHVVPRLAGRPCRWLELGSYEGRSALWTLEHVLTHPESRLVCVDVWYNKKASDRFDANILGSVHGPKVTKITATCFEALRFISGPLDAVYIDADHQAKEALSQAAMVWPLLRQGGVLIWDDYPWQHKDPESKLLPPKPGVDAFLHCWTGSYSTLHHGYQVIICKL